MADRFKPEDLSPYLFAQVGDFLLFRGDDEKAAGYFRKLKEDYPKSDYLDYAYAGLGEVAFGKKDYPGALELFTDAMDKIGASSKIKEATVGKAKALLALKPYPEAKKLFEHDIAAQTGEVGYALSQISRLDFPEPAQLRTVPELILARRMPEALAPDGGCAGCTVGGGHHECDLYGERGGVRGKL